MFCFRNLDPLTETYGLSFYMQYLAHWPEYFQVAESPSGEIMGYSKYSSIINLLCLFTFINFQLWGKRKGTVKIGTGMLLR